MIQKLKDRVKEAAIWLVYTKLGRFLGAFILSAIFNALYENLEWEWAYWAMLICVAYVAGFIAISIVFAWIINPIKWFINNYKNKK